MRSARVILSGRYYLQENRPSSVCVSSHTHESLFFKTSLLSCEFPHRVPGFRGDIREVGFEVGVFVRAELVHGVQEVRHADDFQRSGEHEAEKGQVRELGDKHSSAQRRGRRSYDFNRVVEASEPGLHASGRLLDVVLEDILLGFVKPACEQLKRKQRGRVRPCHPTGKPDSVKLSIA